MIGTETTSARVELLPPALSKVEARSLETSARRHWRAASRNALVFAAELRRLHDGGAHLVRGFDSFAVYAEQMFDGLTAGAAKHLSRQGGVLLALEHHGRLDLADLGRPPVAATALRALSVVGNTYGEQPMLAVFDRAVELRPGRAIVEQTVKAAMRALGMATVVPQLSFGEGDAAGHEALDVGELADDDEFSEEVHVIVDRLDVLRRHVDDLRLSIEDPIVARRELRNIEEEIAQVRAAMAVAYGEC